MVRPALNDIEHVLRPQVSLLGRGKRIHERLKMLAGTQELSLYFPHFRFLKSRHTLFARRLQGHSPEPGVTLQKLSVASLVCNDSSVYKVQHIALLYGFEPMGYGDQGLGARNPPDGLQHRLFRSPI